MKLIRLPALVLFLLASLMFMLSMALMGACAWLAAFLGGCAGYKVPKEEDPCAPPH